MIAVSVLAAAGCGWTHPRFDTANTGHNPLETTISAATVGSLAEQFRVVADAPGSVPPFVVARGRIFAGARTTAVFDAAGVDGCGGTPRTCSARWTLDGGGVPDGYDRVLYLGSSAYDADGATGCAGAPAICGAVWSETPGFASGAGPTDPSALHLVPQLVPFTPGGELVTVNGYDTDCGTSAPDCPPRWSSETLYGFGAAPVSRPATDGSRVFAAATASATATTGTLYAWDGTRANGPRLWSAVLPGRSTEFVAVADGVVVTVVQSGTDRRLVAYDAAGVTNCAGAPAVCGPIWQSDLWQGAGTERAPAIADGVVYRVTGGRLAAYDLHGVGACTGVPATCSQQWDASSGADLSAPAVANGLVFVGDASGRVAAFDARGAANCSATIRHCAPLWSADLGVAAGAPAVTGGRLFVATADGTVRAFGLPS